MSYTDHSVQQVELTYSFYGVSSTKDFHSRIGIFEPCQYSTNSRVICWAAVLSVISSRLTRLHLGRETELQSVDLLVNYVYLMFKIYF